MRGTLVDGDFMSTEHGIIPAHAGNTTMRNFPYLRDEGSSPRMRGTLMGFATLPVTFGIIPAHAGNTDRIVGIILIVGDHPRACGEHLRYVRLFDQCTGSSPRMRGTLLVDTPIWTSSGIIPAHAGNTLPLWRVRSGTRDHPRACGEHQ